MKLIDLLDLFDIDFDSQDEECQKAVAVWNELLSAPGAAYGEGDRITMDHLWDFAAFSWLAEVIRAGAFEDYPRKITLTRTFTYEGKMDFPCCFTNSPGSMIDSEVYDPPIEMKPERNRSALDKAQVAEALEKLWKDSIEKRDALVYGSILWNIANDISWGVFGELKMVLQGQYDYGRGE